MDRGLPWSALVVLGALDLQVALPEGVKLAENCVQCLNFLLSVLNLRSLLTVLRWFGIEVLGTLPCKPITVIFKKRVRNVIIEMS